MFKLRKLNAKGVAHHAVLMLVVVVSIAGIGAYLVSKSNANNVYSGVNAHNCFPGKKRSNPPTSPPCKLFGQIENVKADCAKYFLQFDGTQCKANCIAGYHINDAGVCHINDPEGPAGNGGGTGGGGSGGGGGSSGQPTEAECGALKRRNDNKTNNRCEECYAAFSDDTPHTFNDACVKKTITQTTTDGAGSGGTGSNTGSNTNSNNSNGGKGNQIPSTPTDNADAITCAAQNKKWHAAKKICGPECATGFIAATEGICSAVAPGSELAAGKCGDVATPDGNCVKLKNIERYCDSRHFKLTDNKKNCKLDCVKGYLISGTVCVKKGESATPSPTSSPAVLGLDTTMDKDTCAALGREWENRAVLDDGTLGNGCATNACDKAKVAIVTQNDGAPYCEGYISKNDKSVCENKLHRKWVAAANGCMKNPKDKEAGKREANAPQCQKKYSTYVWRNAGDECMDPDVVDQLKGIAQATGKPFIALSNMSQAQLCNVQPHKHWNGKKCVKDRPAQSTDGGVNTPASDPTPPGDTSLAPNGKSWDSYCASLGRNTAGHCGTCKSSSNMLYGTDNYGWRRCVPKSSICEQGGGTKICGNPPTGGSSTGTNNPSCPTGTHAAYNGSSLTCVPNQVSDPASVYEKKVGCSYFYNTVMGTGEFLNCAGLYDKTKYSTACKPGYGPAETKTFSKSISGTNDINKYITATC